MRSFAMVVGTIIALSSPIVRADSCPPEGTGKTATSMALNKLKNRTAKPAPTDIDPAITLAAIAAPGEDRDRFTPTQAATITGYVAKISAGGIEWANCDEWDAAQRDTHIDIVVDPKDADDESKHFIVEVTPRVRQMMAAQGKDWSTAALRRNILGRRMTFTGWMLFDGKHADAAANTASPDSWGIWRATAWEIHPVTEMGSAQ